ncbi:nuclear transport factor 2 family protein [Flavihumibacter rivuli]|uniref:nuclear transport factor 2 family protein n=1 Tax=Flavihumibacter rivuli TaxID=2838156 RepID=UPI001BDF2513|nr:nuclear transport factor 2 family protein [Flavihumibacter rivuli]ULQ55196.1 nuclear transport factor 2 family protein [Flavihumibacter rivuli]
MRYLLILLCMYSAFGCQETNDPSTSFDKDIEKALIAATLDSFNVAAARADYDRYFGFYTDNATFNGTDATENWDKAAFMAWSKPIFDKGKAWSFTAIKRNIYFGKHPDMAWFDELLSTQMKICRGSGVMVKVGNEWKVQQYVLSITAPNTILDSIIPMKAPIEDSLVKAWGK